MTDTCKRCRKSADKTTAAQCRRRACGLSLLLSGPERFQRKYKADLETWLNAELLYHCFTGENDDYKLARVYHLDHVLQSSLLEKAEREWPARLEMLRQERVKEKQESKQLVQQFVLAV